ncbi:M56 family metallopeptidase [Ekhidna sp.]
MNEAILFLLESSATLGILYLIYHALLRKEASLNFNRFYLLGVLVCSFTLPLLSIDFTSDKGGIIDQPIKQLSDARVGYQDIVKNWSYGIIDQNFSSSSITSIKEGKHRNLFFDILLIVYAIGLIVSIFRLIWMLRWIFKLKSGNSKEIVSGLTIVKVPQPIAPFSFLNSVFVSIEMLDSDEFAHILEHEKTHIQQRHSFDLIIVQLLSAILWFNPVIWWLNKSLKTTHEYIADRKMIKKGYSLVEYQTLLLRQLISNNSFGLVHNFNLSFIKKRITMMNIQKIGNLGKFKVATVITLTVLFSLVIVQCNSKLEEQDLSLTEEFSVDFPVIQDTKYVFNISSEVRFDIIIKNDLIYFKDELMTLKELSSFDGDFHPKAQMILKVDKNQQMKLVRNVQDVLREKELRMIVYVGKNESGELLNIPMMLPPAPNSKSGITVPELTDKFVQENGIQLLDVDMGKTQEQYSELIYKSLHDPMIDKSAFVVRGRYEDDDTYEEYLTSLNSMKQGYYDYYEEKAQELYGKSFYDINRAQKTSEKAKQQYREVRRGVPMAISIE